MKTVCICSSFKFYEKVLSLKERLESLGIKCLIPLPSQKYRKPENPQELIDNFNQSEKLEDFSIMSLIDEILSDDELIEILKI